MGCFGYICKGCNTQIVGDCFNGGEKAILKHLRNGKILGEAEGYYDEYGRLMDKNKKLLSFRNTEDEDINSHKSICDSELYLKNSTSVINSKRLYKGQEVEISQLSKIIIKEEFLKSEKDMNKVFKEMVKIIEREKSIDGSNDILLERIEKEMNSKESINIRMMGFELLANILIPEIFSYNAKNLDIMKDNESLQNAFKIIDTLWDTLERPTRENYSGVIAWHSKCYYNATKEEQDDLRPSKFDPHQSCGEIREEYR